MDEDDFPSKIKTTWKRLKKDKIFGEIGPYSKPKSPYFVSTEFSRGLKRHIPDLSIRDANWTRAQYPVHIRSRQLPEGDGKDDLFQLDEALGMDHHYKTGLWAEADGLIKEGNHRKAKKVKTQAANAMLLQAAADNNDKATKRALAFGADVNVKDENGMTALIRAARGGYMDVMRRLVNKKADLEIVDRKRCTALIWAIDFGHDHAVRLLLLAGADVNKPSVGGWTPLMWASKHGHARVTQLLLRHGADTHLKTNTGMKAVELARRLRHQTHHNHVAALLSVERIQHPEGRLGANALLAHYDADHVADYEWDLSHGIVGCEEEKKAERHFLRLA